MLQILVVEDEFLIASEIAEILEDAGHRVMGPVGTVRAASDLIAGGPPDFAVIDANLTNESSAPLARELRERGIPFCVCTGYRSSDLKEAFGDVATLQKPIGPQALISLINLLSPAK